MSFKRSFMGLFLLFVFSISVHAQSRVTFRISEADNGEKILQRILAKFKQGAEFRINGRALEIQRACELNEKQFKQLEAASEGSLNAFYNNEKEEKEKTLRSYQQQAGIAADDDNGEEEEEEEFNRPIGSCAFYLQFNPSELVDQETLWNKSLKKILTDEQQEKHKQARLEQQKFLRAAAVEQYVAQLELRLFLSIEQRNQIRTIVEDHLSDHLMKLLRHDLRKNYDFESAVPIAVESKYAQLVSGILTEAQLNEWSRVVEPEIAKIKELPDW